MCGSNLKFNVAENNNEIYAEGNRLTVFSENEAWVRPVSEHFLSFVAC